MAAVVANVHAKVAWWAMNEPDTASNFLGRELLSQGFHPFRKAGLGQEVFPQIGQLNPPAFAVQRQPLATELDRAGYEVVVGSAPMLVAKRVIPDVIHPAEYEAVLPMNLAIQVHAKALRGKIIQERFERMEIVVAEIG